ncbi:MAG: hypothetical protein EOO00_14835, partial [Chitinophagaceae bacterium]
MPVQRMPVKVTSLRAVFCLFVFLSLTIAGCDKHDDDPVKVTPDLKVIASDLASPITFAEPPDGTHRLFIVDQVGKIWIIGANGQKLSQPFIDVSARMVTLNTNYDERGLLGLAFHPAYKTNGKFYLYYTA